MSGGSLDYVSYKVDEAIYEIKKQSKNPLHRKFADHLILVGQALHDLEWVLSGDFSAGDEEEAINKVLYQNKSRSKK